jgi:hypothetical protein
VPTASACPGAVGAWAYHASTMAAEALPAAIRL